LTLTVTGRMTGPIRIYPLDEIKPSDMIELGSFSRTRGTARELELVAEEQGITLELDPNVEPKLPDFLEVKGPIQQEGRPRWRLIVSVSEEKALQTSLGHFGGDEGQLAVQLLIKCNGKPPQPLRIPISGTVK